MARPFWIVGLFLAGAARLWAQGDIIKFRDPKEPDAACEVVSMSYKQVKYNLYVNGEHAGAFQRNAAEVSEIHFSNERKPYDFTLAEQNMSGGLFDEAIKRFEKALRSSECPDPVRQLGRISIARCYYRAGLWDRVLPYLQDFRREMPESFYFAETFSLQYDAFRIRGDVASMERTLQEFMKEAENRSVSYWKNSAELLNDDLYEMQSKWNQALAIHSKYASDSAVGKSARLGELRCLSALANWSQLKQKADSILGEARGKKNYDEQLLTAAYNARGDCSMEAKRTKEALLDYLRGVVLLNTSGEATREHEASLAKAAIACARLANELRDQERATYKLRARELQADLLKTYPGSGWAKPVGEAIQAVR